MPQILLNMLFWKINFIKMMKIFICDNLLLAFLNWPTAHFKTASTKFKNVIEDSTGKVKENSNIFYVWEMKRQLFRGLSNINSKKCGKNYIYSTILLCTSSFGSFLDLLMYDRTAAMAAGIFLMYKRKNFNLVQT